MAVSIQQIKELREATGAGVMECRKALEKANGNFDEAVDFVREKGLETATQRSDREASEGMVELYSHGNGRVGVMVEVNCETDFVARSNEFREFAHEIALQIAAMAPLYVSAEDIPAEMIELERESALTLAREGGKPEKIWDRIVEGRLEKYKNENCLLRQAYIRDDNITIDQLLLEKIAAIGENIVIRRLERWELGESTAD